MICVGVGFRSVGGGNVVGLGCGGLWIWGSVSVVVLVFGVVGYGSWWHGGFGVEFRWWF